jgi:hypothetical protein
MNRLKKMKVVNIFGLLILMLCPYNIAAQSIHKKDLENIVAILRTSHPNLTQNSINDSIYVGNKPIDSEFLRILKNPQNNIDQLYPVNYDDPIRNSRLRISNQDLSSQTLLIEPNRKILILFWNSMHESSAYYLTSWEIFGDSLHFEKLYELPINLGIANLEFDQNYIKDYNGNYIFILSKSSDEYLVYQYSRNNNFHELLKKSYSTEKTSYNGTEHNVVIKFLDRKDLLIQEYWFSYEAKRENNYVYVVRNLIDSKLEIIDLRRIVR